VVLVVEGPAAGMSLFLPCHTSYHLPVADGILSVAFAASARPAGCDPEKRIRVEEEDNSALQRKN